jgi:arylsulfatase A-like enzyme
MLTGHTAHETGMLGLAHRGFDLKDYSRHLARRLSAQGFHTALAGVQHEYRNDAEPGGVYDQILTADKPWSKDLKSTHAASEFLQDGLPEKPWFLWVGLLAPHRGFRMPDPDRHRAEWIKVPDILPDNRVTREDMAAYHATVETTDDSLGKVLDALEASGQAEDTLVILTTDHGIAFPHMKCCLTQHGTGITWIMRHPGSVPAGTATDALVSHLDFVPTVMDQLGLEVPDDGHGVSLKPVIRDLKTEVREDVFAEVNVHASIEPKRSVRTHRFNFIRLYESDLRPVLPNIDNSPSKTCWMEQGYADRLREPVQLYDLMLDPQERHNVADDPRYADARQEMEQRLEHWMRKTNDPLLEGPLVIPAGAIVNDKTLQTSPDEDTVTLKNPLVVE